LKGLTNILNLTYGLIVLLFLLDSLESFDIKNQLLKSFVYFGVLLETPFILIWNFFYFKKKTKRLLAVAFPVIILFNILIIGPTNFLFSTGSWQTQEILYQNRNSSYKQVEFQMKNIGAFGYQKRIVEVYYLTPLFIVSKEVCANITKRSEWKKVHKFPNEMGIKFP
jgi:hypothetical protein